MERYEKYKDSGVEWIREIPEGWEVKKLKYCVLKVGSGITPKGGANVYQLFGVPLLRSQNVHFDGLKLDDVAYISQETHDIMANSKVLSGDVLLNITGASIGRCFYVDNSLGEANVNQHVCIIRPKEGVNKKYLYFILMSNIGQNQIDVEQTGSGREGLNFEALNNFLIPQIKPEEQTAFANYLDRKTAEIDELIAQKERLIEMYEEEKTTIINQAVTKGIDTDARLKHSGIDWFGEIPEGWELSKLKYLVDVKDGTHDTPSYIQQSEKSYPLVTSKDIKSGLIDFSECKHISFKNYDSINKRSDVTKNDIIMPMIGTVGGAVLVETDEPFSIKNVALFKTSISGRVPLYIKYLIESSIVKKQFDLESRGGVQNFVSLSLLKNIIVFNVSNEDQTAIVNHIETETARINAKIAKTKRIIELQKEYLTALISEVVMGKIKVTEETTP